MNFFNILIHTYNLVIKIMKFIYLDTLVVVDYIEDIVDLWQNLDDVEED